MLADMAGIIAIAFGYFPLIEEVGGHGLQNVAGLFFPGFLARLFPPVWVFTLGGLGLGVCFFGGLVLAFFHLARLGCKLEKAEGKTQINLRGLLRKARRLLTSASHVLVACYLVAFFATYTAMAQEVATVAKTVAITPTTAQSAMTSSEPFQLLSAVAAEANLVRFGVDNSTNVLELVRLDNGATNVVALAGSSVSTNSVGNACLVLSDGSVYTVVSLQDGYVVFQSEDALYGSHPQITLCMALLLAGGVILVGVASYRILKCAMRVATNHLKDLTNALTNDELVISAPPATPINMAVPNCLLQLPDGMTVAFTNVTAYRAGSVAGLTIDGCPVTEEILLPIYSTNLVAVGKDGTVHKCELQFSTNLLDWAPFVGANGTVMMDRKWYAGSGSSQVGLTLRQIGGIACCTNLSTVVFDSIGVEYDATVSTSAGLPKIPGQNQVFWRLKVGD